MANTIKKIMTNPKKIPKSRVRRRGIRSLEKAKRKTTKTPTVISPNNLKRNRPRRNPSNLTYSSVIPIFKGKTVYVIGGGPSLQGFNWNSLSNKSVIAINKSFMSIPTAQVIYWTDARFYRWYKKDIDASNAVKYTINSGAPYTNDVRLLKKGIRHGLETDNRSLAHGDNSGYAAINLAYHLGATRIVLLGFDMGGNGNKTHFHDGYPVNPTSKHIYEKRFVVSFPHIAEELKKKGIKVYNASERSTLTCFTKISLEKSLSL